jgi:hypothetical protein
MKDEHSFDRIREDVEERRRAILWEDARKGGRSVDAFLWKGDPKAKPAQRIGLVLFALTFPILSIVFASIPFQKKFENGWSIEFFMALLLFLVSMRLLRNGFLRSPRHRGSDEPTR